MAFFIQSYIKSQIFQFFVIFFFWSFHLIKIGFCSFDLFGDIRHLLLPSLTSFNLFTILEEEKMIFTVENGSCAEMKCREIPEQ